MLDRRRLLYGAGIAAVLAAGGFTALSLTSSAGASGPVFTGKTDGIAINGYDTVSYFKQEKPVPGSAEFTHEWRGVKWQFSTAENRDLFAAEPEKYAPQYGGYCAYAAASNALAKTEPDAFTLHDGKLYLNFDQNIKKRWDGDKQSFITSADRYWPELSKK